MATQTVSDLERRYRKLARVDTDVRDHLPLFVETVVALDASTVIELGVRQGNSTLAWLYGLEQTGGHLWSVDVDCARQRVGEYPHWTLFEGSDLDADILDRLPQQADIVFIDTSHNYEHTLDELAVYVPRVRPGGCVFLHDTELEVADDARDDAFPVWRALDWYCEQTGLTWVNRSGSYGLGRIDL